MYCRNLTYCIFVVHFVVSISLAQFDGYTPTYPIQSSKTYKTANIYQQDFLYYCDALLNSHPNVYTNYPKEKFVLNKKKLLEKLSQCKSAEEFSMNLHQFIAPMKDTHTKISGVRFFGDKTYPIRHKFYSDSLYIINMTDQQSSDLFGAVLQSINGISLRNIKIKAAQYTNYENDVSLKNNINLAINNSGFLKTLGIIKNENDSITVRTNDGRILKLAPNSNSNWQIKYISHPITEKKKINFDYQIIQDKDLCYLQLNKFIDKKIAEMYIEMLPFWKKLIVKSKMALGSIPEGYDRSFSDFLNTMVADIKKNDIDNLIIDLRHSSGGSMIIGHQLMYFLGVDKYKSFSSEIRKSELYNIQMEDLDLLDKIDKDTSELENIGLALTHDTEGVKDIINRFNGNVYFLIAEWTYSSAVMLATTIKDNKLFTIVGEPTSQRPSHLGEILFLRLPNTEIVCNISCKQFHRPDREKDNEDSLYPDVVIMKTFDSLVEGKDLAFDWILSDIKSK